MKRPWLSVAVFCAVFSGIILFCIIFGGYSSLYRAQNRINAAKGLVTVECQKRLDLIPELVTMAGKVELSAPISQNKLAGINRTAKDTQTILTLINKESPLGKEVITVFEQSQVRLTQEITGLILELKKDENFGSSPAFISLEKKFENLEISVFFNSHKYNKEARYFNTRKTIFPGLIIAKLFGLEEIHFPEITAGLFTPEKRKS